MIRCWNATGTAFRLIARPSSRRSCSPVDMARELEGQNVTVNAVHPASYMPTKIVVGLFGVQSTLEEGIASVVRLACSSEAERFSGQYFDRQRTARPDAQAMDAQARRELALLS